MLSTHQSHYHLLRMTEIGRLFWAHTLVVLSGSLVGVFVPIYLLKLGYSFTDVLMFLTLLQAFSFVLQIPVIQGVTRLGPHRMMGFGIVLQVVFFSLLVSLPTLHWPLWLPALSWALYRTAYWPAFHINFSRAEHQHNATKEIGSIQAMVTLMKGIAPAIGGLIAGMFGIHWIYGVAIGMSVIAALPLLKPEERPYRFPPSRRRFNFAKVRLDLLANAANAMTTGAESTVWPILVFLLLETYQGVGLLSSVVALASISTALYVGARTKRRGPRHFMSEGVTLSSFADVLRLAAQNSGHVFGINLFTGVGNSLYYTPFFSRYYQHAGEESRVEYVTGMEMASMLGTLVIFTAMWAASFHFAIRETLLIGIALAVPANFLIRRIR